MPMGDFDRRMAEDARLVILRELAAQLDHRLNSSILSEALYAYGHNRSRDWLHTQLSILADLGAIQTLDVGSVIIASLTALGLDHVERRVVLSGVKRPSLGG